MIHFKNTREVPADQLQSWLQDLSVHLRPADLDEMKATHSLPPIECLAQSVAMSTLCWIALDGDTPFCVFGCAPSAAPGVGVAWLVGTARLDTIPHTFVRNTLRHLKEMHRLFPCLFNYIDARNVRSMEWLRVCGFSLLEAIPDHGIERRPFILFARLDHQNV